MCSGISARSSDGSIFTRAGCYGAAAGPVTEFLSGAVTVPGSKTHDGSSTGVAGKRATLA
jgi:hypothetical protein